MYFCVRKLGISAILAAALVGCAEQDPMTVSGFVLPEGNLERGQAVFTTHQCHRCHTISNVELPAWDAERPLPFTIELGGKQTRVKNYGELLTSIVNPQHVVSRDYLRQLDAEQAMDATSPMPNFNHVMTVAQLIDLVQFLHSTYERLVPDYRGYQYIAP